MVGRKVRDTALKLRMWSPRLILYSRSPHNPKCSRIVGAELGGAGAYTGCRTATLPTRTRRRGVYISRVFTDGAPSRIPCWQVLFGPLGDAGAEHAAGLAPLHSMIDTDRTATAFLRRREKEACT